MITYTNVQNAILAMSFNIAELAFHKSLVRDVKQIRNFV